MTPADVLTAHGILRAPEVVELAAATGLDLAAAATLLAKESGGGRNVWGHDAVPTGGCYTPGEVVTRADYLAYRAAVLVGRAGRQGIGPCQLTNGDLQNQADKIGGCWDWRANCRVGFAHLAFLTRRYGVREGFARYNGSGPAADRYADDAMTRLAQWRAWLANTEGDDVALSDDDIAKIAAAAAEAVWRRSTLNSWGDWVGADQILNATEKRTEAILDAVQRRPPVKETTEAPPAPPL